MLVTSIVDPRSGVTIPTAVDNNTLCLACHAGFEPFRDLTGPMIAEYEKNRDAIAKVVSSHTHHPYAPERSMGLSRCERCHMGKVATTAVSYDLHSHTFEAIPPQKTLVYQDKGGMPNSCQLCHRNILGSLGARFDSSITNWAEPTDRDLANELMKYYGPDGKWWKLDVTKPKK